MDLDFEPLGLFFFPQDSFHRSSGYRANKIVNASVEIIFKLVELFVNNSRGTWYSLSVCQSLLRFCQSSPRIFDKFSRCFCPLFCFSAIFQPFRLTLLVLTLLLFPGFSNLSIDHFWDSFFSYLVWWTWSALPWWTRCWLWQSLSKDRDIKLFIL